MASNEFQKRDVRQEVTQLIIEKLERGVMPWRRGWSSVDKTDMALIPRNGESGRNYRGGNRLHLMVRMLENGWEDPRFFTFNQLQKLGAYPEKGSRGSAVEYWDEMPFWKRRDCSVKIGDEVVWVHGVERVGTQTIAIVGPDMREVYASHLRVVGPGDKEYTWFQAENNLNLVFSRHAVVFNVHQCRGLDKYLAENPIDLPKRTPIELDNTLDAIVVGMKNTGLAVKFEPQNRAYYIPFADTVVLPLREQFDSDVAFRSTLLHELAHATGHEKRLNRETLTKSGGFGSKDYAREELVAELASAFMSAETGIERDDDQHAAYIQSWLEVLKSKDGKHVIFEAAREAEKATNYLLDRADLMREVDRNREKQSTEVEIA
jgi:antirestriction protein ArdC